MSSPTLTSIAHCYHCDAPLTKRADGKWIHRDTRRVFCDPSFIYLGRATVGYWSTSPAPTRRTK